MGRVLQRLVVAALLLGAPGCVPAVVGAILATSGGGGSSGGGAPPGGGGGAPPGGNLPGNNQPGGNQPGGNQPGGNQPGGNQPGGGGGPISPPPPPVDDHANDETTTSEPTLGTPMAGSLEVAGDVDWFRVQLVAGTPYELRTQALTGGLDTVLTLRDAAGVALASNDDDGSAPGSLASRLVYTATTTGPHYLEVRGDPPGTGSYQLLARDLPTGPVDAARSTMTATPDTVLVGGATATVQITARRSDGTPLAGRTVTLSASGSGSVTIVQPGPTDAAGVTTGTIASADAGVRALTAVVDGTTLSARPRVSFWTGQNGALRFDGGDAIDLPNNASYDLGREFTFEAWIKPDAHRPDEGFVFNKWQVAVEDKIFHIVTGPPSVGTAGPDANVSGPDPLPLGRWSHVAGVMDAAGMRMYVDGRLVASSTATGDMKDAGGVPRIGRYLRDSRVWGSISGLLDEVRLSRVARYSADFVPAKRHAPDGDAFLLLHFDELQGVVAGDAAPSANDGTLAPGAETPVWVAEEILVPDALLTAAVRVAVKTVRPADTGRVVEVQLVNGGTAAATVQGAQLTFDPPGAAATRTDGVTSVPAGGLATLTFAVDVPPGTSTGAVLIDATVQAVDAVNGAACPPRSISRAAWTVVDWVGLGGSGDVAGLSSSLAASRAPSVVLLGDQPVVAWSEGGLTPEVVVARWDGTAWSTLAGVPGPEVVSNDAGASRAPRLSAGPSGRLVVAWEDDTSGTDEVLARAWDGAAWVELAGSGGSGGLSGTPGTPSRAPDLDVDADERPVVAWEEGSLPSVHLRRWDGSAWVELGGSATGGGLSGAVTPARRPAVAVDAARRPWVAWVEGVSTLRVAQWTGAAWVALAAVTTTGAVGRVDLRLTAGPTQRPVLAWDDDATGAAEVHVVVWDGTAWQGLGGSETGGGVSASPAVASTSPSLGVDTTGRPVLGWEEAGSPGQVHVARWSGTAWVACAQSRSAGGLSSSTGDALRPSLVLDAGGAPVVAWEDASRDPGAGEVRLLRYRGEYLATFEQFEASSRYADLFTVNGDAGPTGSTMRLTRATTSRRGSAFLSRPLDLSSFRARFTFRVGEADGITLAMVQGTSPNLLGGEGSGMGVEGLDGYAVEFDPWGGAGDISDNHVGFLRAVSMERLFQLDLPTPRLDLNPFVAEVLFEQGRVRLWLESAAAGYPRTLVIDHTRPELTAFRGYLGFTGATGGVYGHQEVDDVLLIVEP